MAKTTASTTAVTAAVLGFSVEDDEDLLSDIYCDFFDAWSCDENLYFAGGYFYWKPFNDEEIVLKEGTY